MTSSIHDVRRPGNNIVQMDTDLYHTTSCQVLDTQWQVCIWICPLWLRVLVPLSWGPPRPDGPQSGSRATRGWATTTISSSALGCNGWMELGFGHWGIQHHITMWVQRILPCIWSHIRASRQKVWNKWARSHQRQALGVPCLEHFNLSCSTFLTVVCQLRYIIATWLTEVWALFGDVLGHWVLGHWVPLVSYPSLFTSAKWVAGWGAYWINANERKLINLLRKILHPARWKINHHAQKGSETCTWYPSTHLKSLHAQ